VTFPLIPQVPGRDAAQFGVDQGRELLERLTVARTPPDQQRGHRIGGHNEAV
jgi:hypothetical protein